VQALELRVISLISITRNKRRNKLTGRLKACKSINICHKRFARMMKLTLLFGERKFNRTKEGTQQFFPCRNSPLKAKNIIIPVLKVTTDVTSAY
jgi:hypothetical protein